jgi:hypothetical protein
MLQRIKEINMNENASYKDSYISKSYMLVMIFFSLESSALFFVLVFNITSLEAFYLSGHDYQK